MSHFTHKKTRLKNLFYLKKALNRLHINAREKKKTCLNSGLSKTNLIINQSNGHEIIFSWDKQSYELVTDLDFWKQSYPVKSFIDKVSQQYANEYIIGESQKIGFQLQEFKSNSEGIKTLTLERWNMCR